MLTKKALTQQLTKLGVAKGDLLMVHASLRKLGPIENKATGVIEAILDSLGSVGTMVMLLGSAQGDMFVPESSVADPDNGVLAEQFRQFFQTKVNNHPASRMGAIGNCSEEILQPVSLHNYYGQDTPIERFILRGGKVLRLGANIDTMTRLVQTDKDIHVEVFLPS